jgi:sterol desaturase/sphingolipid hydroxylase (fatty acid hydroxylase superfamily)
MDISALDLSQAFASVIYFLVYQLGMALAAPLMLRSELYWVFLCSGLVIAWVTWKFYLVKRTESSKSFFKTYFSKDIWWHPSAKTDYRFYLINAVLMAWITSQFWLTDRTLASWLDMAFGTAPLSGDITSATGPGAAQSGWVAKVVFTLLFFIAYDFGRFVAHSLLHDVPWLWEFHKVHHSAEVLTPITAFRVHPIDLMVMAWVPVLFTGLLTWVTHRWLTSDITFFIFMGFHALVWLFNLVDHLRHWHVWVHYGPRLNNWLISPAHHQLHHSADPEHWGCNRGYELAIWDRLYGTFISPQHIQHPITLGLGDGSDHQWQSAKALFFKPFALLVKPDTSLLHTTRALPNTNQPHQ